MSGWSWYTGSASWFFIIVLKYLLGITVESNCIKISPSLPNEIKKVDFRLKVKNKSFKVEIINEQTDCIWEISIGKNRYEKIHIDEISENETLVVKRRE